MSFNGLSKPLSAKQIDFRVQSINRGGYATILAYKDARVDMHRLDEVAGVGFWQRRHEFKNNNLYCSVGLYNKELKEWVWIEDVGTVSNTEATKGQASDAFKRACFNFGIGRELYDYPMISIKLAANEVDLSGQKPKQTYNLKLKQWVWYSEFNELNEITFLAAKDEKNKVRFQWGERGKGVAP